jgi:hypothetical protein
VSLVQLIGWDVWLCIQSPRFKSPLGLNLGAYFLFLMKNRIVSSRLDLVFFINKKAVAPPLCALEGFIDTMHCTRHTASALGYY